MGSSPASGARPFDVAALDGWLAARPPTTLLALADRLLVASVVGARGLQSARHAEGRALADRFVDDVVAAAHGPFAAEHRTTLCVLGACLADLGVDESRLDRLRTGIALAHRSVGFPDGEPWRSVARYWLWRAGLARDFSVDAPPPTNPVLAFAYFSHLVLFDAAYGRTPVAAPRGYDEAARCVDLDDGDSVALLLLSGACHLTPPDPAPLWLRLGALQHDDGGLVTRADGDAARHHAACVAVLAHDLLHAKPAAEEADS